MMGHRTTVARRGCLLCSLLLLLAVAQVRSAPAFRAETSILGESAIIDKTTGRIYWEHAHRNTLSASLGPRLRKIVGVHFRATILSTILWMAVGGRLVERSQWAPHLQQVLQKQQQQPATTITWIKTVLLSCGHTLLHSLPRCPRSLLYLAVGLYLLESYQCSTRQYLSHSVPDVESCIADLRTADPIIQWKVRSFHYENPLVRVVWTMPRGVLQRLGPPWNQQQHKNATTNNATEVSTNSSTMTTTVSSSSSSAPSLWRCWKVVTHVSRHDYAYSSCVDRTVAGVWKRSWAATTTTTTHTPPFKVRLTKTVLLSTPKTRVDYFRQLRAFLRSTQGLDALSECTTTISIPGYTPRYLQLTSQRRGLHALFWISTCCGLTVPFRRWLDARCDQVRVTVVKETGSTSSGKSSTSSSSFAFQKRNSNETSAVKSNQGDATGTK